MTDDATIRHGGNNIFADLGFPDAETHLLKAELVKRMDEFISEKGLALEESAGRMGVSANDASRLTRGQFRDISVGSLIKMLNRLGCDVEIVVRERGSAKTERDSLRAPAAE